MEAGEDANLEDAMAPAEKTVWVIFAAPRYQQATVRQIREMRSPGSNTKIIRWLWQRTL